MENGKKNTLSIIIIIVIALALGGWLLFGSGSGTTSGQTTSGSAPAKAELAPALQLTPQEKSGDVSAKRAEVLRLVQSSTPLTQAQKAEIGGIMLTKANLYNFSEAERQDIFKALSK